MKIFNFQFSIFNCERGFTMLEMVIVTGILGVLLISTTGFFSGGLKLQKDVGATYEVLQNAQFALEIMSRNIRFSGTNPKCGAVDPPCTGSTITVSSSDGTRQISYSLSGGKIVETKTSPSETADLTFSGVTITRLVFDVKSQVLSSPFRQPQVTIILGIADVANPAKTIDIQTTVSLRAIEF